MKNKCLLCGDSDIFELIDLGLQPVSTHFSTSSACHSKKNKLVLSVCKSCTIIQIKDAFPYPDLLPIFPWISYKEPEDHLDTLVDKIQLFTNNNISIAGISFKDKSTIDRFNSRGFKNTWILDIQNDLYIKNKNASIETIQEFLSKESSKEIAKKRGQVDLLIARHIVEHATKPKKFLESISNLIKPGGYLIIEVPDSQKNLELQDYTMIWEEHVLYFAYDNVYKILDNTDFSLIDIFKFKYPFEDILVMIARKNYGNDYCIKQKIISNKKGGENLYSLAIDYSKSFNMWTNLYNKYFENLIESGEKIAIFGAGHLSTAFILYHNLVKHIAIVIDDTKEKQGLFLASTNIPIRSSESLITNNITICFIGISPVKESLIFENNYMYLERGGKFYSLLSDSTISIKNLL